MSHRKIGWEASTRSGARTFCAIVFGVTVFASLGALGVAPSWWTSRGVIEASSAGNDFEAVNAGQVKHVAKMAAAEMNANLVEGAGDSIDQMVTSFSSVSPTDSDFEAVNVGQLKAVAKPFYDRLIELGLASAYPWSDSDPYRDDFRLANAGQVKNLFSFLIASVDSDGDGLPDEWEISMFGDLSHDSNGDGESSGMGDQLTNEEEYWMGVDPNDFNTLVDHSSTGLKVATPIK